MSFPQQFNHSKAKDMSTEAERDFLTLFQFVINCGAEVVRDFIDPFILSTHKTFERYLHFTKHFFYHQFNPRFFCCECPNAGCQMQRSKTINKQLFEIMYLEDNNRCNSTHEGYVGKGKVTKCICVYVEKKVDINSFDLSALRVICQSLNITQKQADIQILVDIRNKLSHALSSKTFEKTDLQRLWKQLEEAIVNISSSPRLMKRMIEDAKKKILNNDDVENLRVLVKKCLQERDEMLKDGDYIRENTDSQLKLSEIKMTVDKGKEEVCNRLCQIEKVTDDNTDGLQQIRKSMVEEFGKLQAMIRLVIKILKKHKGYKKERKRNKEEALEKSSKDRNESPGCLTKKRRLSLANMTEDSNTEQEAFRNSSKEKNLLKGTCRMESAVLDNDKVLECISAESNKDNIDSFPIQSAKKSCIYLEVVASPGIFSSAESLRYAIRSLIQRVLNAGSVDTGREATVTVVLTINTPLNEEQLRAVQTMLGDANDKTSGLEQQVIVENKNQCAKDIEKDDDTQNINGGFEGSDDQEDFDIETDDDTQNINSGFEDSDDQEDFGSRPEQPNRENSGEEEQSKQEKDAEYRKLYEENQSLMKENKRLEKENERLMQDALVKKNEVLKREREQLRQQTRIKMPISFHSVLKQPQSDQAVSGITALLQQELHDVELDLVPESKRSKNIPLLVVLYNLSRLMDDVRGALSGVEASSDVALVVLHSKEIKKPSEKLLTEPEFKKLGIIVDMSFLSAKGIIENDVTSNAINQLVGFINRS